MRNIGEVLDRLKAIVPATERPEIEAFVDNFRYRAPEQLPACWREVQDWLFRLVELSGKPLRIFEGEEWKAEAIALWMGRPLADLWRDGLVVYRDLGERVEGLTSRPEEALRQIRGPGPMVDAAGDEDVR